MELSFKLPKAIFKLMESLRPGNGRTALRLFEEVCKTQPAEMVFVMMVRQIRLLLQIKAGVSLKMAPWQMNQLRAQTSAFETGQLLDLHKKMLRIDIDVKTGNNLLRLPHLLDALVVSL
jgi:hypothetical protein